MRSATTHILPVAVTLALVCGAAHAGNGIDEEGFHGYLRATGRKAAMAWAAIR